MSEFLAEARVTIVPDTTKFRALLEAELAVATRKPIVIPVLAAGGGREAALASGAALEKQAVATNELARVQDRAAISAQKLTLAQTAVAGAASAVGASQIAFTRSVAAVTAAEAELAVALRTNDVALIDAARNSVKLAEAQRLEALTALEAARAQQAHAASLGGVSKGASSAGLSLLGIRGATLAASGPFLAGAAAAVIFAKSIQSAAALEQDLNVFRAVAGATADEMHRVADEAQRLGRDVSLPAVAAGDAAEAMTDLAKAGLSVQDALDGARGTLLLATAAEINNADATELVANALNAFQLQGTDAAHVADLLAGAANASQGSISDIGIAFQQVAGAVAPLGVSLEDTIALLSLLAKNGLQASDAGTALRVAVLNLAAPSDKARGVLQQLQLQVRDTQGEFRPEVFAEFAKATEDLSKAEQTRLARIVFGQSSIRAFNLLAREGIAGLDASRVATNKQGEAARTAGARTQGFSGQVEALSSNLETLGTTIGTLVLPVVGNLVFGLNLLVGGINSAVGAAKDFAAPAFEMGKSTEELTDQLNEATKKGLAFAPLFDGAFPPALQERIDALSAALSPKLADAMHDAGQRAIGLKDNLKDLDTTVDAAARAIPVSIDTRLAVTEATGGSDQEVISILREKEAKQAAFLERMLALPQTKSRQKTVEDAARNLEQTRGRIQSILDDQAAEAKSAAQDAVRAASEADQAIIDSISAQESKLTNQTISAQATATLKDDIKAQEILRNFFKRSIAEVRKTVGDAKARAQEIGSLTRDLITAEQEVARLKAEQKDALKAERREERERQRESLSLDVQIAEATGNKSAEARARQAEIEQIKEEIRQTRAGSNQRKRLILELRQKQAELKELRKEKETTNKQAQDLTFFFLQQQQGFAANLLGNLIPSGATSGLVGGTAQAAIRPPGMGVTQESHIAQAKDVGFSAGQGNTTNSILRKILHNLEILNGHSAHPEARNQRVMQSGSAHYAGV